MEVACRGFSAKGSAEPVVVVEVREAFEALIEGAEFQGRA
jgi:hypothetical protein